MCSKTTGEGESQDRWSRPYKDKMSSERLYHSSRCYFWWFESVGRLWDRASICCVVSTVVCGPQHIRSGTSHHLFVNQWLKASVMGRGGNCHQADAQSSPGWTQCGFHTCLGVGALHCLAGVCALSWVLWGWDWLWEAPRGEGRIRVKHLEDLKENEYLLLGRHLPLWGPNKLMPTRHSG